MSATSNTTRLPDASEDDVPAAADGPARAVAAAEQEQQVQHEQQPAAQQEQQPDWTKELDDNRRQRGEDKDKAEGGCHMGFMVSKLEAGFRHFCLGWFHGQRRRLQFEPTPMAITGHIASGNASSEGSSGTTEHEPPPYPVLHPRRS